MGTPTLPSAMPHFTAEFEMGSGGSMALLSPENWLLIDKVYKTDVWNMSLPLGNQINQRSLWSMRLDELSSSNRNHLKRDLTLL
jgi:hypothetical protein